jgi:hypothetical protein
VRDDVENLSEDFSHDQLRQLPVLQLERVLAAQRAREQVVVAFLEWACAVDASDVTGRLIGVVGAD